MITYVIGDIFLSPARTLINPVNTVGVMGSGLAGEFKRFYPEMFDEYQKLCEEDAFDIGNLFLYRTTHKSILNFPIKKHYRAKAKTEHVEAGLQKFLSIYAEQDITSISFPAFGSEDDDLDWDRDVQPLMESYLDPLPISVYIHLNHLPNPFEPAHRSVRAIRKWLNTTPQAITFKKFWSDITRALKSDSKLSTLGDEKQDYRILISQRKGRRKPNLMIRPNNNPKPEFVAESSLQDLWGYIQRTGFVLPYNLPGGLSQHAPYLFGLLSKLPYISPVLLWTVGGEPIIGLQYIPPAPKNDAVDTIPLDSVNS